MSSSPHSTTDLGALFVAITGETTLVERQDALASTVTEVRAADRELVADLTASIGETGLEDTLTTPEVQ